MIVTLDLETLPTNDSDVIADLSGSITAPGNYTKPESIQKWKDENYASVLQERVHKTGLDGLYGRVCVVCAAIDDGPVEMFYGNDEPTLIDGFYEWLSGELRLAPSVWAANVTFCGHNIAGFDLPFLKHRSMVLGLRPPAPLRRAMESRPWEDCIADTMLMWSSDREKRVSMDKLCKALGIPGKGDMDGSQVAELWKTDPQKVVQYCADDVRRTRLIYKRMTWCEA